MKTIKTLWIIYSCCGLLVLAATLLVPPGMLLEHTPLCYSVKQYGRECFMCGSTRSFIQAGMGNFGNAIRLNRLAFALFVITAANTTLFIVYLLTNLKKTNR